jgi:hypothetical protein
VRLFIGQTRRLLLRPRAILAASAILVYTAIQVYRLRSGWAEGTQDQESWWYILIKATAYMRLVFPLLIIGAVGTSIGEDRRSGFTSLVAVRSRRPLVSFLAHFVAMLVSAAVIAAVPLALAGSLARIVGPPAVTGFFSHLPAGFPSSPFLLEVLPASLYGAAAMLSITIAGFVGLFTTNPFAIVGSSSLLMLVPPATLYGFLPGVQVLDPYLVFNGEGLVVTSLVALGIVTLAVLFLASAVVVRRGGVP